MSDTLGAYRPTMAWLTLCGMAFVVAIALEVVSSYNRSLAWTGGSPYKDLFFIFDLFFGVVCLGCLILYTARNVEVAKWVMIGWSAAKADDFLQREVDVWLVAKVACASTVLLVLMTPHIRAWVRGFRR